MLCNSCDGVHTLFCPVTSRTTASCCERNIRGMEFSPLKQVLGSAGSVETGLPQAYSVDCVQEEDLPLT